MKSTSETAPLQQQQQEEEQRGNTGRGTEEGKKGS